MQVLLVLYCKVQAVFKENDKILLPLMRYCMMHLVPLKSPHVRESRFQNACGFQNPRLWNPKFCSRNPESHKRLESRIQVPLTKTGIHPYYPESTAWNPESKTSLDSLRWGDRKLLVLSGQRFVRNLLNLI